MVVDSRQMGVGVELMFLGIDPGRAKCGWALVASDGALCASGIVPSELPDRWLRGELAEWTLERISFPNEPISCVVLGSGTGSKIIAERLAPLGLEIKIVDERCTTLAARRLYWRLHPPRGLWVLVPTSIRVPKRDIDDLAAWAIVLQMMKREI